jgi:hypothetical protein
MTTTQARRAGSVLDMANGAKVLRIFMISAIKYLRGIADASLLDFYAESPSTNQPALMRVCPVTAVRTSNDLGGRCVTA